MQHHINLQPSHQVAVCSSPMYTHTKGPSKSIGEEASQPAISGGLSVQIQNQKDGEAG